jgi:hypothetical protein
MGDGNRSLKTAYDLALTRGLDAGLSKSPWVLGFNNAAHGILASANNTSSLQYTAGSSAPKNT